MRAELLPLLALWIGSPLSAQTPTRTHGPQLDCGEELVRFSPPERTFLDRIHIGAPTEGAPHVAMDTPGVDVAPQRTRWFAVDRPDTTVEGPWSTELRVYSNPRGTPILKARFEDHHSYKVKFQWITDKLLFVEVWWGRLGATQIVLNVESRIPVYIENAYFPECQEPAIVQ